MSNLSSQVRARAAQLAVLSLTFAAPAASAQSQADADLKAISAYPLTMAKYKQYLDASLNVANVAVKDPSLKARFDGFGNKSLSEQVKVLDGVSQIKSAIGAAGLTTRDYVLTQGALLQAGMAYAMTKGTGVTVDSVIKTAGVSRANLEFYQKNEAEITRLAKEAEAKAPKPPPEADGADDDGYDDSGDDADGAAE